METNDDRKMVVHAAMGTNADINDLHYNAFIRGIKYGIERGKYFAMTVVIGVFVVVYLMFYAIDKTWEKLQNWFWWSQRSLTRQSFQGPAPGATTNSFRYVRGGRR